MNDTAPLPLCSVLLLSGGRGNRMGGRDKGLVEWQGRSMIAWLHDLVRPLTDDLIISCNRNGERYAGFADRLVQDDDHEFQGPLAGIRAGLAVARHPYVLVLPCDAPLLDRGLLIALLQTVVIHPDKPVMVRRGEQWEPLFSCIPRACAPALDAAWGSGERSPRRLLLSLGAVPLPCAEDDPRLANLNTPALLEETSAANKGE